MELIFTILPGFLATFLAGNIAVSSRRTFSDFFGCDFLATSSYNETSHLLGRGMEGYELIVEWEILRSL